MILDDYSMSISDYSNLGSVLFECAQSHRLLESIWPWFNIQTSILLRKEDSGQMAQDQGFRLSYHPQRRRDASHPNYYFEPQGSRKCSPSFIVAVLLLPVNPQCSQNRKKGWHRACHSKGKDSSRLGTDSCLPNIVIFVQMTSSGGPGCFLTRFFDT